MLLSNKRDRTLKTCNDMERSLSFEDNRLKLSEMRLLNIRINKNTCTRGLGSLEIISIDRVMKLT